MLNLAHLLVWFLAFWLLLEFQWSHALGLAAILTVLWFIAVLRFMRVSEWPDGPTSGKKKGRGYFGSACRRDWRVC